MYVVTFYSFKGGVGRSMAMVNVGLDLVKSGRSVLLIDFDLEAPGLETFNLPKPSIETPGMVDYVIHYLEKNAAPDVKNYIYECYGDFSKEGRLWIMPAGKQDNTYSTRLYKIDWGKLYEKHEGYLMFEDLKAQWKTYINPDYVLIDSRTGHTDIGGICTRQLPDAVSILFFPNEQNLLGLTKIVSDIRNEANGPRKKNIHLHFITSNVPDLDDEDHILQTRIQRFKDLLMFQEPSATIHHYDSLALLNQVVFTVDRPHSRLAQEYRDLVKAIVRFNHEDREGVLDYLKNVVLSSDLETEEIDMPVMEQSLDAITSFHQKDGEIMYRVALIREEQGDYNAALELVDKSITNGYRHPNIILKRAELSDITNNRENVLADIKEVLDYSNVPFPIVRKSIRLLRDRNLDFVPDSPAFKSLDINQRVNLFNRFSNRRSLLPIAEKIIDNILQDSNLRSDANKGSISELSIWLIGMKRFKTAMNLICPDDSDVSNLTIVETFNYAMASWAEYSSPPRNLFQRVIEMDEKRSREHNTANYYQCLAIAHWATGNIEGAKTMVDRARQKIMEDRSFEFSAWHYRTVSFRQFTRDMDSLEEMITGKDIIPLFMTESGSTDYKFK